MAGKTATRIHELIPVEADKVNAANAITAEAINTFAKKPEHFVGHVRKVEMYDTAREIENTSDVKPVVETVESKLGHVWSALRAAIDVTLTKENSNTSEEARADVIVDGVVVIPSVPATALLALEKKLGSLKDLYSAIPTLDPTFVWVEDPSASLPGMFRTAAPQEGQKTEKVVEHKVLYEATKEHPAQVKEYTMDRNVAKVSTERQSGMISPATKSLWLGRITQLATAVKQARQRANMAEIKKLEPGKAIRDFIHAPA